jgi:hypothetical protein
MVPPTGCLEEVEVYFLRPALFGSLKSIVKHFDMVIDIALLSWVGKSSRRTSILEQDRSQRDA